MSKTTIFLIVAAVLVAAFFVWKVFFKKPIQPAALGIGSGTPVPGLRKVQVVAATDVFSFVDETTGATGTNIPISSEYVGALLGTAKREFTAGGKVWIELFSPSGQPYSVDGQPVKRFVEKNNKVVIL